MKDWLARLAARLSTEPVVVVTVLSAAGSVPREAGARMLVTAEESCGTIGGGALEFQAIAGARDRLRREHAAWSRQVVEVPLGPALQQCCGGFVYLLHEVLRPAQRGDVARWAETTGLLVRPTTSGVPPRCVEDRHAITDLPLPVAKYVRACLAGTVPAGFMSLAAGPCHWLVEPLRHVATPLYLYGAGHVGRAVVHALADLDFAITWVDVAASRFPATVSAWATRCIAHDPVAVAAGAAPGAFHVIMTFSHALDEAIATALLERNDFAFLGLIGSATKRARFVQRFRRSGIAETVLARLTCPIGHPDITGKAPAHIALALAAQLVMERDRLALPQARGSAIADAEQIRDPRR